MMDATATALGIMIKGLGGPVARAPTKHIWLDANDWLIDLFGSDLAGMGTVIDILLESMQKVDWKAELPKFCTLRLSVLPPSVCMPIAIDFCASFTQLKVPLNACD
jgi:hypothetical protein